jgi:periplasmic divalent cation tolerance protein
MSLRLFSRKKDEKMIIVLCTYPNREKAEDAAVQIVEKELAACVNIIKIENSVYRWKEKTENHPEFLLIIKTTEKAYKQLELFIKSAHPYDVPEILKLAVDGGNKEYIQWVTANTLSKLLRVPLDFKATNRASDPSKDETRARKPSTLSK